MVNLDCKKEAKFLKGVQKFTNVWVDITGLDPTRNSRNSWAITFKRITDSHIYCIFHATHHTNPSTMTTKKNYRVLGKPQGFKAQSNFIGTGLTNTLCLLFSSHENIHLFRLRPNRELGTLKTLGSWPNTYQIFRSPSEKQKKEWDFQIFGSLTVLLFLIPSIVSCVLCCFVWSCLYKSSFALERSRNYMFQPLYVIFPRFVGWNWLKLTDLRFFLGKPWLKSSLICCNN